MKSKRTTVYNAQLVTEEIWTQVNDKNKKLLKEFVNYCTSSDRSPNTIYQYSEQLKVFFAWNCVENSNKFFVDIKKRDYVNFFGYGRNELQWSPSRLASFKAVLSSLSNYIERILDDDYPSFKNIVKVLEPIRVEPVREKTVLSCEQIDDAFEKMEQADMIQEACWLALLYSSGMRKSEAAQMKLDFFTQDNIVFDLMYRTPKIRTKGRGKKGKQVPRYIFVYTFQPYLEKWLKKREQLNIQSEYLFVNKRNNTYQPATISTFNSWAQRIGELMGVELYPHSLRHAWTTKLKRSGYPIEIIQKLQNWSSSQLVEVYSDITQEEELSNFFKANSKTTGDRQT